jgi:DNA-binding LacI/PurR family transcriptional regulator
MDQPRRSISRSATSRDVARAAGVSQALVSRAFSGTGRVAPETRDRILEVAGQLGWRPNALAASMVTGDAPLVAVITTRLSFEWRAQVLSRLLRDFEASHLKPLLFYADSDDEVDRLLGEVISWRTRGVIVTAGVVERVRAEAILTRGQFLVALNRPANHPVGFSVATDNCGGGASAAEFFLAEGRRKFLVVAGLEDSWASAERSEGFVMALGAHGFDAAIWNNETMSTESGLAAAARFLSLPKAERPDAVFATNDAMALGFLDGLRESNLDIPAELSLIGFDNLPAAAWAPYRLTTFEQPLDDMVNAVLAHVAAHRQEVAAGDSSGRIEGGADRLIRFAPKLIRRKTTRETTL